jgi:hypothetical protein
VAKPSEMLTPELLALVTTDKLDAFTRRDMAIAMIQDVGDVDGAHHKQWLIDQVLRLLAGPDYENVVREIMDGRDGPETFGWDVGIAP